MWRLDHGGFVLFVLLRLSVLFIIIIFSRFKRCHFYGAFRCYFIYISGLFLVAQAMAIRGGSFYVSITPVGVFLSNGLIFISIQVVAFRPRDSPCGAVPFFYGWKLA